MKFARTFRDGDGDNRWWSPCPSAVWWGESEASSHAVYPIPSFYSWGGDIRRWFKETIFLPLAVPSPLSYSLSHPPALFIVTRVLMKCSCYDLSLTQHIHKTLPKTVNDSPLNSCGIPMDHSWLDTGHGLKYSPLLWERKRHRCFYHLPYLLQGHMKTCFLQQVVNNKCGGGKKW